MGGVLVFGDLHISDREKVGKHKNYFSECCWVLEQIENIVEEKNPEAVVLLGDLVGDKERNVRHRETLVRIFDFLKKIGRGRKVYSLRGNHDIGDYPDFKLFSHFGLFETSETCRGYFDFCNTRFHLVDYGNEKKKIELLKGGSNIVLGHNNFTITGVTNWFRVPDGIEVSSLQNFKGIDLLISGHIHIPSPELVHDDMLNCGLFYVGSPTRIHEQIEQCWYMEFSKEGENVVFSANIFKLLPLAETWNLENKEITEEAALDNERKRALSEILTEMNEYHIGGVDLETLIRNIPNARDSAKEKAVEYYNKALNNKNIK